MDATLRERRVKQDSSGLMASRRSKHFYHQFRDLVPGDLVQIAGGEPGTFQGISTRRSPHQITVLLVSSSDTRYAKTLPSRVNILGRELSVVADLQSPSIKETEGYRSQSSSYLF